MKLTVYIQVFLILFTSGIVNAKKRHKRKTVIVIEYRAGVAEQPDFTKRIASILRMKTNLRILTNRDGRRIIGAKFDEMAAKCQSNFMCFARLGRKIHAQEVLLVVLSEFGNVLINITRIIVKTRKIRGSTDLDVEKGGRITKFQLFSALKKVLPASYFKQKGYLIITSNTRKASVLINNKRIGYTPVPPVKLKAPDEYFIKVTKKGYTSFTASVSLVPRAQLKINARLFPEASIKRDKWYNKWWVWAIAGSVAITAGSVMWYYYNVPNTVPAEIELQ